MLLKSATIYATMMEHRTTSSTKNAGASTTRSHSHHNPAPSTIITQQMKHIWTSRRTALATPLLLLPVAVPTCVDAAAAAPASAAAGGTSTAAAAAAAAPPLARRQLLPPLLSISGDYDSYAPSYDDLDGGALPEALGFDELRVALISEARGDVLESAVGTGLNLPLYDAARVASVTGIDISRGMLAQAAPRAAALAARISSSGSSSSGGGNSEDVGGSGSSGIASSSSSSSGNSPVRLLPADAAALPFADASFDCAVDTFSLCVMERPAAAVSEMARVLRPGGRLLLLEHTRSDNPVLAAYQDVTNSAVRPLSKGCAWNQDVEGYVRAAGLRVTRLERRLAGTVTLLVAERG